MLTQMHSRLSTTMTCCYYGSICSCQMCSQMYTTQCIFLHSDEAAPVKPSIDTGAVGRSKGICCARFHECHCLPGLSHASHYDLLLSALLPMKAHWFDLGMNLKLSENFLDEMETNIETEEECLGEVLQNWLLYHNPTLETLNNALSQMNASPIALGGISTRTHV